jgi:hypothetical protein
MWPRSKMKWWLLGLLCVLIDLVGLASVVWGEWVDVAWAPSSAVLLRFLFPDQVRPRVCRSHTRSTEGAGPAQVVLPVLQLVEELLPITDVVPTATLGASMSPQAHLPLNRFWRLTWASAWALAMAWPPAAFLWDAWSRRRARPPRPARRT